MPFVAVEKTALKTIASLYLVRMTGLFMVLPVLSLYGKNLSGASPLLLGLALGIYGLAQALLQIPFGAASDRLGRKKLLVFGFGLFVLGSLICAHADSIEMLIVGRVCQGAGAVSSVLLALLADMISAANRTMAMAIVGITIGLSFGVSVIFGPLIASHLGGLQAIFYLNAILGLLAIALVVWGLQEPERTHRQPSPPRGLRAVLIPDLLRLDAGIFSLHLMQMCIWVAVPGLLLGQLGIGLDHHWVVYLATVGGGFVLMLPFMRFWDKRGQTRTAILVSIAVCGVAMLLMGLGQGRLWFLLGLFLFFWGFNLLEATLPSAVTKVADAEHKGAATGVYSSCQFFGVFCGGLIGGGLVSYFGSDSVFYFAAGLALIWLLITWPGRNFGAQPRT